MKRVLCLLSNMNAGGAETFLMKIYRELDKTKYQMDFCVNVNEKNYYEDEIYALGGKMFRVSARSNGIQRHNKELFLVIKENNYKFVLAVSSSSTAYLDLKFAKKAGAKWCCVRSSNSNIGMPTKQRVIQEGLRVLYNKYADVLIAPSDLAAECLFGHHYRDDKRFVYLRNALNIDRFQFSEEKRKSIRKQLSVEDTAYIVGHVGRFYKQKNHDFLIGIFAEIAKERPDAKLLMVGSGELKADICRKVERMGLMSQVIFAGTRSDVNDILSAMDIFIFPSFFEGMPNTVIEAQANGLPCLISDSITKDADITGNVCFFDISRSAREWADQTRCMKRKSDSSIMLREKGYGIKDCVKRFEENIWERYSSDKN